jgi:hypothetical protein
VSLRAQRSNLIYGNRLKSEDCFVASLLAMTGEKTLYEFAKIHEQKTFQSAYGGLKGILIWDNSLFIANAMFVTLPKQRS